MDDWSLYMKSCGYYVHKLSSIRAYPCCGCNGFGRFEPEAGAPRIPKVKTGKAPDNNHHAEFTTGDARGKRYTYDCCQTCEHLTRATSKDPCHSCLGSEGYPYYKRRASLPKLTEKPEDKGMYDKDCRKCISTDVLTSQEPCASCVDFNKYEETTEPMGPTTTITPEQKPVLSRKARRKPFLVDFVDKKITIVLQIPDKNSPGSLNKRRHHGVIVPESLTLKPGFLTLLQQNDKDADDGSQTYRSFPLEAIVEVVLDGRLITGVQ